MGNLKSPTKLGNFNFVESYQNGQPQESYKIGQLQILYDLALIRWLWYHCKGFGDQGGSVDFKNLLWNHYQTLNPRPPY